MRAIDADALIDNICRYASPEMAWDRIDIIHKIDEMPTIEERKTGMWETYVISMIDGEGCRCSECGFEGVPYWDFCPNCGADMRGKNHVAD